MMKKIIFLILYLSIFLFSCDEKQETKVTEKIEVESNKDTSIVIIDTNTTNIIEYTEITNLEQSKWKSLNFKKNNGLLESKVYFHNDIIVGPVYYFSDKGR